MKTLHLPMRWYIAEINHLQSILNTMPAVYPGTHRGVPVARIIHNNKQVQYGPRYHNYKKLLELAANRQKTIDRLNLLKKEWNLYFKRPFESESQNYLTSPNKTVKYDTEYWNRLIDDECDMENQNDYHWDGHNFRSRFEMNVAQAARDLHLDYKYDSGIRISDKLCYVDFAFVFECFNRTAFCECLGQMTSAGYVSRNMEKFQVYNSSGIYLNRDLFAICADNNYMPNDDQVKHTLILMVEILCDLYMTPVK